MVKELTNQTDQQQKTISVLVSEKNALSSSVERLQDAESKLDDTTTLLQAERSRADRLQTTVNDLTVKNHDAGHRVSELAASEKALTDKTRDLERELHALNTTVGELRTQSAKYQRRIRELEEQIDSDDRAERLEETLRNTQNRADELEFQVSKLQQAQSTVRSEREQLDSQLRILAESEGHWKDQHAELDRMYQAAQDQILAASAQRDTLRQEKSSLEKEVATGQTTLGELQQKLAQSVSELNVSVRVLQQTQAELKTAQRRADEAEKAQSNLQAEGIALMRSLEEMRPKIVELTDAKLDLGEKVEGLTRSLRARDDTIAQLESELDELRDQHANGEAMRRALDSALEKERTLSQASTSELHQSHSELTKELERLRAASHTLEEERSEYRQMASQHMQEVQKLTASVQTTADQLSSLRSEVEERKQAQEEAQEVLERARGELEMLRAELSTKEEHIERLHEFATKPTPTAAGAANALGDEILSAMRQQHELELSEAQSEIRSLETAVYEAESHALAMQRQVAALETQLSRPNSRTSHQQRPSIPPARFSSNRINTTIVDNHYHRHPSDDLRRASFSSVRNANANHHVHPTRSTSPPSAFEGLSAETRHKRRVSLGMLKARIDSEAAAAAAAAQSWRTSSPVQKHHPGLPTVVELPPPSSTAFSPKRTTVYLDDSHVFWCHSCKGDLVIL
ncbi:hypothetical protein BC835DRAFT_1276803 [Cytidiella melzeri]|nr:hypothetical protein BC835DRAFT_1276803 [Cytidiella melzeri]